jgi:hypothetical protein
LPFANLFCFGKVINKDTFIIVLQALQSRCFDETNVVIDFSAHHIPNLKEDLRCYGEPDTGRCAGGHQVAWV